MYRRLAYLVAWAVATSITVGVAWLGIRSVLSAAAPTRNLPLSAAQLHRVAPNEPSSSASASPSPGSSLPASPKAPVPTPTESWTQAENGFNRTFQTVGGEVSFFTGKDSVQVLSSTPKPGYTVNVTRYAGDSVMVSFFGTRKTSRVWVRWWNGPYAEITESVA